MSALNSEHDYLFDPPLEEFVGIDNGRKGPTAVWKLAEVGVVFVAVLGVALSGSWFDSEARPDNNCCERPGQPCRGKHYHLVKVLFAASIAFLAIVTCIYGYYYGIRARSKQKTHRLVIQMRAISPLSSPLL